MASNNFLVFNENRSSNTLNDTDYGNNTQRKNGISYGAPANSAMFNKVLRQATLIAWAMADIIKDTGADVSDNDATTFKNQVKGYIDNTITSALDNRIPSEKANDLVLYGNISVTDSSISFSLGSDTVGEKKLSIANKQDKLTDAQMSAVNSGINETKLNTMTQNISNHATAINTLNTNVNTHGTDISTLKGYFSSGVAKKASADGDGNNIKNTYATKTELSEIETNLNGAKLTTQQRTALNNLVNGIIKIGDWTLSIVS